MSRKQIGFVLALLVMALGVLAVIDGGEEPLHPIEQSIDLPEGVR